MAKELFYFNPIHTVSKFEEKFPNSTVNKLYSGSTIMLLMVIMVVGGMTRKVQGRKKSWGDWPQTVELLTDPRRSFIERETLSVSQLVTLHALMTTTTQPHDHSSILFPPRVLAPISPFTHSTHHSLSVSVQLPCHEIIIKYCIQNLISSIVEWSTISINHDQSEIVVVYSISKYLFNAPFWCAFCVVRLGPFKRHLGVCIVRICDKTNWLVRWRKKKKRRD